MNDSRLTTAQSCTDVTPHADCATIRFLHAFPRPAMHRDDPAQLAHAQHGTCRDERVIRAPHGSVLSAMSWLTEAPLRMLLNNLDPDVAENPQELVVYGGIGRAARNWECFDAIIRQLEYCDNSRYVAPF